MVKSGKLVVGGGIKNEFWWFYTPLLISEFFKLSPTSKSATLNFKCTQNFDPFMCGIANKKVTLNR